MRVRTLSWFADRMARSSNVRTTVLRGWSVWVLNLVRGEKTLTIHSVFTCMCVFLPVPDAWVERQRRLGVA